MVGHRDYYTKRSKSQKKDNTIGYHLHMESYCDTNEFVDERETDSQTQRIDLPRQRGWGRDGLRVWDWRTQITYRMDKQDLTVISDTEKYGKEVYMYN